MSGSWHLRMVAILDFAVALIPFVVFLHAFPDETTYRKGQQYLVWPFALGLTALAIGCGIGILRRQDWARTINVFAAVLYLGFFILKDILSIFRNGYVTTADFTFMNVLASAIPVIASAYIFWVLRIDPDCQSAWRRLGRQ